MEYVVAGVLFVVFGWYAYRCAYLQWRGIRTTGTIVELVKDESGEGITFTPVVSFTTNQGVQIVVKSFFGTGSYFRIGEKVDILYSAKNPRHFAIVGYEISVLLLLGLLVIGALGLFYYHGVK